MLVTDPAPPAAQETEQRPWYRKPFVVVALIVGVVMAVPIALLLLLAGLLTIRSESSSTEPVELDAPAFGEEALNPYFGSLELAQGSSIDLGIDTVTSIADVQLLSAPTGLAVEIVEDENGVRLMIEVPRNHPVGSQSLVFAIAGEREPVTWEFNVLPN